VQRVKLYRKLNLGALDAPGGPHHSQAGAGQRAARHRVVLASPRFKESIMVWKTPKIVEVSLALEINSYACAEVG